MTLGDLPQGGWWFGGDLVAPELRQPPLHLAWVESALGVDPHTGDDSVSRQRVPFLLGRALLDGCHVNAPIIPVMRVSSA